jgi:alpha-galactosidase
VLPGPSPIFADGLHLAGMAFLPRVKVDGAWHGAGLDGACVKADTQLRCPAGAGVAVVISSPSSGLVHVHVDLARAATIDAIEAFADSVQHDATGWISNGFQSWSASGVVAIGSPVDDAVVEGAAAARGDAEVLRTGAELSWWLTAFGGGKDAPVWCSARTAETAPTLWRAWAQVSRTDKGLRLRLVSGGSGEHVRASAGGTVAALDWSVGAAPAGYVGYRHGEQRTDAGWNSWYQLWDAVNEQDIRDNATLFGKVVKPWLLPGESPLMVVDDGWQVRWGEWTVNGKFKSGLDGLAKDLKTQGFAMGVWLAPLLVDAKSELVALHPDWFVKGASYLHLKNGEMRVLDVTHPGAAKHLHDVIANLVAQGLTLLKIDFLFAGTYEGARFESVTGMQAYERALQIIREAAGKGTNLVAVGAAPIPTSRYVDVWRQGNDIALEPFGTSFAYAVNQLRSLAVHHPFCADMRCDADPPMLRELTQDEVGFGAWVVAAAGGGLFLSDDLRVLPQERLGWLDADLVKLARSGKPAVPEQLFPPNPPATLANPLVDHANGSITQVIPTVWRFPDGRRMAFNTAETDVIIEGVAVPRHAARVLPATLP